MLYLCVCVYVCICVCTHARVCPCTHLHMHTPRGSELVRRHAPQGGFASPSGTCCWVGDPPGAGPAMCWVPVSPSRVGLQINPSLLFPQTLHKLGGTPWCSHLLLPKNLQEPSYLLSIPEICAPPPSALAKGSRLWRGSPSPSHPPPSLWFSARPQTP